MGYCTVRDGTRIHWTDWGQGRPVVFSHGWPLSAEAWETAMFFLARHGYRAIGHDRRGHGRSDQPWGGNDLDTYADDLAAVLDALDVKDAVLVGHSTGGGEVARYVGRHGAGRVAGLVLISAITPSLLRTRANPDGVPLAVFDDIRERLLRDRAKYLRELTVPFFGLDRGTHVSDGQLDSFWAQGMRAGLPNVFECVRAFSETDLTDDLRAIEVPTLVIHGDADQVVPLAASAARAVGILPEATLTVYPGAPHGLPFTHADRLNADLLAFLTSLQARARATHGRVPEPSGA